KSIGFLPVKVHMPTEEEIARHRWQGATLVIDEWILLEYACVFLPAQQNAVVEQVSKAVSPAWLARLGIPAIVPHCRLATLAQAVARAIDRIDVLNVADRVLRDGFDRLRGRI